MDEENKGQEEKEPERGQAWQDDQEDPLGEYYKQISRCDD